jgi:uncharacterized metal-binding protein YceD (DUF177 family)
LGIHYFTWDISALFFELFEFSFFEKGALDIRLEVEKKENMILLVFDVSGTIELICDRSLDAFDYPLKLNETIILKYGDTPEEISDTIEIITPDTQLINIARYIYELISVSIPMKKLHPRYSDEDGDEDEMIYSSKIGEEKEEETPEADPRWNKLKIIKKKHK